MTLCIIGFDPGTTCGIAAVDLDGRVLLMKSIRNASKAQVIEEAMSAGRPVLVASDVFPPQESARKLAASFCARLWCPEVSISTEEKAALSRGFGPQDTHQRDALAAALKCLTEYRPLVRKLQKSGKPDPEGDFVRLLGLGLKEKNRPPRSRETKSEIPIELKYKLALKRIKTLSELLDFERGENESLLEELSRLGQKPRKPRARQKTEPKDRIREFSMQLGCVRLALEALENKRVIILPSSLEGELVYVPVLDRAALSKIKAKVVVTERQECEAQGTDVVLLDGAGGRKFENWAIVPLEGLEKNPRKWMKKYVEDYKNSRKE